MEDALPKRKPTRIPGYRIDKFVVMPNHVHAILVIDGAGSTTATAIIGQYKASVSRLIHQLSPDLVIWQRSFHDHIIRTQKGYEKIWSYIDTNPMRWREDCFYPEGVIL